MAVSTVTMAFGNGAYGCIRRTSTRHLFEHQKWLQLPGNELPNESYVFVTCGNLVKAETEINRRVRVLPKRKMKKKDQGRERGETL
jgi:hypothetical protein